MDPIQATVPTRSTVINGIDQTSISIRREYFKLGWYRVRSLEARNQNATPSVASITGITIAAAAKPSPHGCNWSRDQKSAVDQDLAFRGRL